LISSPEKKRAECMMNWMMQFGIYMIYPRYIQDILCKFFRSNQISSFKLPRKSWKSKWPLLWGSHSQIVPSAKADWGRKVSCPGHGPWKSQKSPQRLGRNQINYEGPGSRKWKWTSILRQISGTY
jgi:hypothetical protein